LPPLRIASATISHGPSLVDGRAPESGMFNAGIALLLVWLITLVAVQPSGNLVHLLLLVGIMFLLIAFLKAREAGVRPPSSDRSGRA
jgi:hypothetical protein